MMESMSGFCSAHSLDFGSEGSMYVPSLKQNVHLDPSQFTKVDLNTEMIVQFSVVRPDKLLP